MKKHRKSKQFLEELKKVPIISSACSKLDISRNTIYRWRKEDRLFAEELDAALGVGDDSINDLAESKVIQHIKNGEPWAIKYWLDNHKMNYIKPRLREFLRTWEGKDEMEQIMNKFTKMIIDMRDAPEESVDLEGATERLNAQAQQNLEAHEEEEYPAYLVASM